MGTRENDLMAQIESAFGDVPYPGDDDLTDASSYGDEPSLLIETFRGKTDWRQLSGEFLSRAVDGSALGFFSYSALHFYIPAYLMADIRDELSISPHVRLTWSLTPQSEGQKIAKVWGGGTMGERARQCFDRFNEAQVRAVIAYLKWKLDRYDDLCIGQALESYWHPRERALHVR